MKRITLPLLAIIMATAMLAASWPAGVVGGATDSLKSYADLLAFLQADQTDALVWTPEFNCVQFSQTLVANARAQGFIAYDAAADWKEPVDGYGGHEFVAVQTIDRGLILIEPQTDGEFLMAAAQIGRLCGDNYCIQGNAASIYYYSGGTFPTFLYP